MEGSLRSYEGGYHTLVELHAHTHRGILEHFFQAGLGPIASFDDESLSQSVPRVVGMGVTFASPTKFHIWGRLYEGWSTNQLLARMVADEPIPIVVWDAGSARDLLQVRDARWGASPSFIDAQAIYRRAFLQRSNLGHVEKIIGFSRGACEFWKHTKEGEWTTEQARDATLHSLDDLLAGDDCAVCPTCGGAQDIAAYCLEDAVSALLVYMTCVNQLDNARAELLAHKTRVKIIYR